MPERMTDERLAEIEAAANVGVWTSQAHEHREELLEALKAERAEVERLRATESGDLFHERKLRLAAKARAERLEKELKRIRPFVQHHKDCRSNFPMTPPRGFNRYPCSCGLQAPQEKGDAQNDG